MPLKEQKVPDVATVNILLYGAEKMRKTSAAFTLPGKTWYLNADLPNAMRPAHRRHNQDGHVTIFELEGLSTLIEVGHVVQQGGPECPVNLVIDPVGEAYRVILEDLGKRALRPTLPTYGDVGTHLERFIRAMCKAPINFVIVGHDYAIQDEGTGEFQRTVWTGTKNPKLGDTIGQMVDVIGYCGVRHEEGKEPEYLAQLAPGGGRKAGHRFDALGASQPTDLSLWLKIIHESEGTLPNDKQAPKGTNIKEVKAA